MFLCIQAFSEDHAMEMCEWKYEAPYDVYNYPDWKTVREQNGGWPPAVALEFNQHLRGMQLKLYVELCKRNMKFIEFTLAV